MDSLPRNAWEAVNRVVAAISRGERVSVSAGVRNRRRLTCAFCPLNVSGRCRECGCFVLAKTMLATEDCPKHKWRG